MLAGHLPVQFAKNAPVPTTADLLIRDHLWWLLHARKCSVKEQNGESSNCHKPECKTFKNLLMHMDVCINGNSCQMPQCVTSRTLIMHYKECNSSECGLCRDNSAATSTSTQPTWQIQTSHMGQTITSAIHTAHPSSLQYDDNFVKNPLNYQNWMLGGPHIPPPGNNMINAPLQAHVMATTASPISPYYHYHLPPKENISHKLKMRPMADMGYNDIPISDSMAMMRSGISLHSITDSSTPSSTSVATVAAATYNRGGESNQFYSDCKFVISGNNAMAPDQDHNSSAHLPSGAAAVAASKIERVEMNFINPSLFSHEAKFEKCQMWPSAAEFGDDFEKLLESGRYGTRHDWSVLSSTLAIHYAKPLCEGANVFCGYQEHTPGIGRPVAIKLVPCTNQSKIEIRMLLKLEDHPHIVKILESGKVPEKVVPRIFIALEFCHQNMVEYIIGNPADMAKARSFFYQTVSAVVYIHSKNVIHRDLKPSNILVSRDGFNIKVSDFGISKDIRSDRTRETVTNAAAGTDGFKAPETYHGNKIGYKSDVFCLGLNGHYIVTHGRHPFGSDPDEWAVNIKKNQNLNISLDACFPSGNSAQQSQLEALFRAMLAQDPTDRPTAQRVQNDDYFQFTC